MPKSPTKHEMMDTRHLATRYMEKSPTFQTQTQKQLLKKSEIFNTTNIIKMMWIRKNCTKKVQFGQTMERSIQGLGRKATRGKARAYSSGRTGADTKATGMKTKLRVSGGSFMLMETYTKDSECTTKPMGTGVIHTLTGLSTKGNGCQTNSKEKALKVDLTALHTREIMCKGRKKATGSSCGRMAVCTKESFITTTSMGMELIIGTMGGSTQALGVKIRWKAKGPSRDQMDGHIQENTDMIRKKGGEYLLDLTGGSMKGSD